MSLLLATSANAEILLNVNSPIRQKNSQVSFLNCGILLQNKTSTSILDGDDLKKVDNFGYQAGVEVFYSGDDFYAVIDKQLYIREYNEWNLLGEIPSSDRYFVGPEKQIFFLSNGIIYKKDRYDNSIFFESNKAVKVIDFYVDNVNLAVLGNDKRVMYVKPSGEKHTIKNVNKLFCAEGNNILYQGSDQKIYHYSLITKNSVEIKFAPRQDYSNLILDKFNKIIIEIDNNINFTEQLPDSLFRRPLSEVFSGSPKVTQLNDEFIVDLWSSGDVVFAKNVDGIVGILDPINLTMMSTGLRVQNIQIIDENASLFLNYYGQVWILNNGKLEKENYLAKDINISKNGLFYIDEHSSASFSKLDGRSGENLREKFSFIIGDNYPIFYGVAQNGDLFNCNINCDLIARDVLKIAKTSNGILYFLSQDQKIYAIDGADVFQVPVKNFNIIDLAAFGEGSIWVLDEDFNASLISYNPDIDNQKWINANIPSFKIKNDKSIRKIKDDVIISGHYMKGRIFSKFQKDLLKSGSLQFEINGTLITIEELLTVPSTSNINFSIGRDGRIWIVVDGTVYLFSVKKKRFLKYNSKNFRSELDFFEGLPNVEVGAIISDAHGRIWFSELEKNFIFGQLNVGEKFSRFEVDSFYPKKVSQQDLYDEVFQYIDLTVDINDTVYAANGYVFKYNARLKQFDHVKIKGGPDWKRNGPFLKISASYPNQIYTLGLEGQLSSLTNGKLKDIRIKRSVTYSDVEVGIDGILWATGINSKGPSSSFVVDKFDRSRKESEVIKYTSRSLMLNDSILIALENSIKGLQDHVYNNESLLLCKTTDKEIFTGMLANCEDIYKEKCIPNPKKPGKKICSFEIDLIETQKCERKNLITTDKISELTIQISEIRDLIVNYEDELSDLGGSKLIPSPNECIEGPELEQEQKDTSLNVSFEKPIGLQIFPTPF